ncbi:CHAT domain-containing protein [Mycena epipterygia]|nr:CHAT domain-containing protein [Mycena epipterygia]
MDSGDITNSKFLLEGEDRVSNTGGVITLVSPATDPDSQDEANDCYNTAHNLFMECKVASNISTLNTAITLLHCGACSLFPTGLGLPECADHLIMALLTRFSYTVDIRDVLKACNLQSTIHVKKEFKEDDFMDTVSDVSKVEDPEEIIAFAAGLLPDFYQAADWTTLENTIFLYHEALTLWPGSHAHRWRWLWELSEALLMQFRITGDLPQLDEAICHLQEVKLLQPNRSSCLLAALTAKNQRVMCLRRQAEAAGLLNGATQSDSEAIELLHSAVLGLLWIVLGKLFEHQGNIADLDMQIEVLQELLAFQLAPHFHFDRSHVLHGLARAVSTRFEQGGDPKDNDEVIDLYREALALHPIQSDFLLNLAHAVWTRFKQRGDHKDIDEAVALCRKALALQVPLDPNRSGGLNNLAGALLIRFEHRGDPKDIDESIAFFRESLALEARSHAERSTVLSNLADAVLTRFKKRGDPQDIDESIALHREAVALAPPSDPHRSIPLQNLALAVYTCYEEYRNRKDIDESIAFYREALQIASYRSKSNSLNNLGVAFSKHFEQYGDPKDIDEAVVVLREALDLRAPPHSERSFSLSDLASAVSLRFEERGDPKDINEAIALHREAVELQAPPNPNRHISLKTLGFTLVRAHKHEPNKDLLNDAMSAFREASKYPYSSPLEHFEVSYASAIIAVQNSHSSSLDAFRETITLLPQLAAVHLDLNSRQKMLSKNQITSLASDAATCAIDLYAYNVAVEFLEASRSIFWAQALHLRTPLHHLKTINPLLASNLEELSRQLEKTSFRDTSLARNPSKETQHAIISMEAEGMRCRQLNEEWEQVINSVRILPGFEDFLKPRNIVALRQAAASGPVIILIAGESASSALVVTSSADVQCVHLAEINLSTIRFYAEVFRSLSNSTFDINELLDNRSPRGDAGDWSELTTRLFGEREAWFKLGPGVDDVAFCILLEHLWKQIVKPVFNCLNLEKSTHPLRLWWCPTGPFAFLPMHAAGIYNGNSTDCVSDYVVSSYTPTLSALLDPPTHTTPTFKITVVIESNATGASPLPGTKAELANIMDRVPPQWLTALDNTDGTQVLHHLQDASVVHFACHGIQDLKNPLDSGLILSDGRLKVSQIMQGSENAGSEKIGNRMSLAVLSACETAKGDDSTPDEAMHLAASIIFAGFRGVVATMWTISDQDGPKVANTFYEHLFKDCDATSSPPVLPDLTKAAEALHLAVSELRKEPGITFKQWVPFIHYGL